MHRNYLARRIRRHGTEYILKQGNTLQPFSAYLKNGNTLMVTALELPTGSLIAPLARPDREYLVAGMEDLKLYELYSLQRINCRASLARFDATGAKDTFGRPAATGATLIYSDIPLYLHPSVNPTDQTTAAISATSTTYRFSVPNGFTIRSKDQLYIGDSTLTVTALLVQPDGITSFTAQDS